MWKFSPASWKNLRTVSKAVREPKFHPVTRQGLSQVLSIANHWWCPNGVLSLPRRFVQSCDQKQWTMPQDIYFLWAHRVWYGQKNILFYLLTALLRSQDTLAVVLFLSSQLKGRASVAARMVRKPVLSFFEPFSLEQPKSSTCAGRFSIFHLLGHQHYTEVGQGISFHPRKWEVPPEDWCTNHPNESNFFTLDLLVCSFSLISYSIREMKTVIPMMAILDLVCIHVAKPSQPLQFPSGF